MSECFNYIVIINHIFALGMMCYVVVLNTLNNLQYRRVIAYYSSEL